MKLKKKQNRNIFWKMFDIFCAFLPIFVELSFAAVGILLISSCPNTAAKAKADSFSLFPQQSHAQRVLALAAT